MTVRTSGSSKRRNHVLFRVQMKLVCIFAFLSTALASCPCKDEKLCSPIVSPPRHEILAFSTKPDYWRKYDWTKLTTVALFRPLNDTDVMCYAHSKGARVVMSANFPVANLSSESERKSWIDNLVVTAKEWHLDGVNIDIEQPFNDAATRAALTQLVFDTKVAFSSAIPGSQVSYDVAWSPDCIDGRCYDVVGLAHAADFLVIMSYDERSQIHGPCIASANSALRQTVEGVQQYLQLGIPAEKLVLGQPWYGYDYPCENMSEGNICHIKEVSFRGVNCSDAAGQEKDYGLIQKILKNSTSGRIWNFTLSAPFFDYKAADGTEHQIWYDDPESLGLKYDYAVANGLRGIAIWTSDSLNYNDLAEMEAMWDRLPTWSDSYP